MSAECAVCYVSDLNFLSPTLVSAASLRKFVPKHKADVYIFLVDEDIQCLEALNAFLKTYNIDILPLDSRVLANLMQINSINRMFRLQRLGVSSSKACCRLPANVLFISMAIFGCAAIHRH